MRTGSRIPLLLGLTGLVLTGLFLFGVFLSGEELAAVDIWKQSESMPAREALAWRKNPEAYAAHSVEITPEMNPVAISIAHWSQSAGFPRSSKFTLTVEDSTGRLVLNKELGLSQKKNEGGSGTPIFEWTSDTPVISLLNDYLEVIEAGTYTFRLIPGETQAGNAVAQAGLPPTMVDGHRRVPAGVYRCRHLHALHPGTNEPRPQKPARAEKKRMRLTPGTEPRPRGCSERPDPRRSQARPTWAAEPSAR